MVHEIHRGLAVPGMVCVTNKTFPLPRAKAKLEYNCTPILVRAIVKAPAACEGSDHIQEQADRMYAAGSRARTLNAGRFVARGAPFFVKT